MDPIKHKLPSMPANLKNELFEKGIRKTFPEGTQILREGQFVEVIPIVLEGLIRVGSRYHERELLLYYIEPSESCIMSFAAGLWDAPSKVFAIAEEETEVLLLPVDLLDQWLVRYPSFNKLFYKQFTKRYEDLLHTIHHLLFDKMDKRLYDFLKEKSDLLGEKTLDLRHNQIARELGTAREVVSRVMRKLEKENKVKQINRKIEIL